MRISKNIHCEYETKAHSICYDLSSIYCNETPKECTKIYPCSKHKNLEILPIKLANLFNNTFDWALKRIDDIFILFWPCKMCSLCQRFNSYWTCHFVRRRFAFLHFFQSNITLHCIFVLVLKIWFYLIY